MLINVRSHHVNITPALKDYAHKKMEKLSKFFDNVQEIMVELDILQNFDENKRQSASAVAWVSGSVIRAKESSKDMYASIDVLFDKLEKQFTKYKEKVKAHKNKDTAAKRSLNSTKNTPKSKIKTLATDKTESIEKHLAKKPMSPEEAAEFLELECLNFVMFRNAYTEKVNVLYLMDDGSYGLIEA
jgi:putative sigma-54 modulation protein